MRVYARLFPRTRTGSSEFSRGRLFHPRWAGSWLGWMGVFCVWVAALLPVPTGAQSFPARNFGPQDGLQNRSIVAIAQDSKGFLWVATQNGLFRYDGSQFVRFSRAEGIADPFLSNLWIGPAGSIWVATPSGLFYSDARAASGPEPRFTELRYHSAAIIVYGNSRMVSLGDDRMLAVGRRGPLLLEWSAGASEWTAEAYSARHPSLSAKQPVWGIFRDRTDALWFGCGQGICRRDLAHDGAATETLAGVPSAGYEMFLQERSGRMWARSTTTVVTWLPGERTVRDLTPTMPASTFNNHRLKIAQDAFDNILVTTTTGFLTWDGHRWTPTDTTSVGALSGATDLFPDREGNLWIGTAGAGAFESLGYRQWQNFGTAEGLDSPIVFSVASTRDGTSWVGTKLGLNKVPTLEMRGTSPAVVASALAGEKGVKWMSNLVPTTDGGVWAASDEGKLWHLDARGRIDRRVSVPEDTQRIVTDSEGTLWLAAAGLSTLRCQPAAGPCSVKPIEDPLLLKANLKDMIFDAEGTLWLLGEHGLFRFRNGTATRIQIPNPPGQFELIALGADGSLWLAGHFPGIVRVRVEGSAGTVVESHAGAELASDYVEILGTDHGGRLWIGTDQGIDVLDGKRWTRITDQDGLIWNDTDWRAFFNDPDGSLWFGTSGGVSHLLHPEAVLARAPFSAAIDQAWYDNVALAPSATVPWTGGILTLHFTGLTFRDSRSMVYHYRLEGFARETVETRAAFARFQQLPPGHYTLHVTAEDPGHHVISAPAEFSFYLDPPWWHTVAFKVFVGFALACLAVLLWFWSNKALLAQRERLQKLVAKRTAELQKQAVTDALTGLLNRGAIMSALDAEARRARQMCAPLCIAIVDLDTLKRSTTPSGTRRETPCCVRRRDGLQPESVSPIRSGGMEERSFSSSCATFRER